jgi:dihydroorotate dehydrogenase (NAD+) catalytic subunit
MSPKVDLSVEFSGLTFKNPVLTASGTFGYGVEFASFYDISVLGGFCTKGLSLKPMAGNAPGRIVETAGGMLNAIGLENVGTEAFITDKLPALKECDCHIIANILGKSTGEFVEIVDRLNPYSKVSGYELNISCPNIKEGGIQFGHDPRLTYEAVKAVRDVSSKPVWVKLSPNVTDITVYARACEDAGADAITLVNTFVGMAIDVYKRRPMLSNNTGGLSGPAIRPLALRLVYQTVQSVDIPVVGIGGISSARDALEFLIGGAMAVQIGTANFVDPMIAPKVVDGLYKYCLEEGIKSIREIIGSLSPIEDGDSVYY